MVGGKNDAKSHLGVIASTGVWARCKQRRIRQLLVVPFLGVALALALFVVLPELNGWQNMKRWQPVPAQLLQAELKQQRNEDSITYLPTAEYQYQFNGRRYTSTRVSVSDSYDNVGNFNYDLGRRLEQAAASNTEVTAYVDPDNPQKAVLNRDLRLSVLAFKLVFMLLFGGVALALIVYLLKAPLPTMNDSSDAKPWLAHRRWASPVVKSNGKRKMISAWAFALVWCAIAIPMGVLLLSKTHKDTNTLLVTMALLLVGLGALLWALKETANWRRFGPAPLQLDPYPGAIGGQLGGTIDIDLPYDSNNTFKVTVQCLESYYTGTGKERQREQRCVWQRMGYAYTMSAPLGTRLEILFNLDDALPESERPAGRYHLWRLNVLGQLNGATFKRRYELPVFATGAKARNVQLLSEDHELAVQEREQQLDSALNIQQIPGGIAVSYPAFRHATIKIIALLFGGGFFTAGFFINDGLGGVLFSAVGALVGLGALYFLLLSLDVRIDRQGLQVQRRLLGVLIKTTQIPRAELTHLAIAQSYSSQTGTQHINYYKMRAHRRRGRAITVGYNFVGEAVAKQALESISLLTGLPEA